MANHHVPSGGVALAGTKVSLASIPQAGRKSLVTCFCNASTTGRISASLSTVLALTIEILIGANTGIASPLHNEFRRTRMGNLRDSVEGKLILRTISTQGHSSLQEYRFPKWENEQGIDWTK